MALGSWILTISETSSCSSHSIVENQEASATKVGFPRILEDPGELKREPFRFQNPRIAEN